MLPAVSNVVAVSRTIYIAQGAIMSDKAPVGTRVWYHGSAGPHGEYVIQGYSDLAERTDLPSEAIAEGYPDGVAYEIWPAGVPVKFGNRHQSIHFVRRASFDLADDE
jgi:hypothetical protein